MFLVLIQLNSKEGQSHFHSKTWQQHKAGFGKVDSNYYWIGLETMHRLTSNKNYKLEINLEKDDGSLDVVTYGTFKVSDEENKYQLTIENFDKGKTQLTDRFKGHNKQYFSTYDRDNDINSGHCGVLYKKVAWWYYNCYDINLNYFASNPYGVKNLKKIKMILKVK